MYILFTLIESQFCTANKKGGGGIECFLSLVRIMKTMEFMLFINLQIQQYLRHNVTKICVGN